VRAITILLAAWMIAPAAVLPGCKDNMFTGNTVPVPPVHRLPEDVAGSVILIDKDPVIETKDPNHVARANAIQLPRDLRIAMKNAFVLAGFKVTGNANEHHDLVAKLAINVTEDGDNVRQVYRCGLSSSRDGTPVVQIDWAWPKGTFVAEGEVYDYATHNVATEVATSRRVLTFLRGARGTSVTKKDPDSDAGSAAPDTPPTK
jgi:hypothetical protein